MRTPRGAVVCRPSRSDPAAPALLAGCHEVIEGSHVTDEPADINPLSLDGDVGFRTVEYHARDVVEPELILTGPGPVRPQTACLRGPFIPMQYTRNSSADALCTRLVSSAPRENPPHMNGVASLEVVTRVVGTVEDCHPLHKEARPALYRPSSTHRFRGWKW